MNNRVTAFWQAAVQAVEGWRVHERMNKAQHLPGC
jgi:hypothetical protein